MWYLTRAANLLRAALALCAAPRQQGERHVVSFCGLVVEEPRLHAAVGSGHLLVRVSMPLGRTCQKAAESISHMSASAD